jgi:hypothetical protein
MKAIDEAIAFLRSCNTSDVSEAARRFTLIGAHSLSDSRGRQAQKSRLTR